MNYVEQDYRDLRLILTDQVLPEEKFSLVAKKSYAENKINIDFGILAESHFVTVRTEKITFTEICVCTDVSVDNIQSIKLTYIGTKTQSVETDAYTYEFMTETTSIEAGALKIKALQRNHSHPDCQYLAHTFPAIDTEPAALTEIHVSIGEDIVIESVHSYPNDDTAVFTTAVLTFKS